MTGIICIEYLIFTESRMFHIRTKKYVLTVFYKRVESDEDTQINMSN